MGIVDRRAPAAEKIVQYPTYNNETMFNPGTAQAPYAGFASNVNVEHPQWWTRKDSERFYTFH